MNQAGHARRQALIEASTTASVGANRGKAGTGLKLLDARSVVSVTGPLS